jgi:DNA replication and repair protein RecF
VPEALRVTSLRTRGFRNLAHLELQPGPRFNVIHGDNGQGKSNLLEALDYLAGLRSFRGATPADMIRREADDAELAAVVEAEPVAHRCRVRLHRNAAREVTLDGKRPKSRTGYLAALQGVLFHPGDLQLVSGAPELRRAWLDRILERFDATYASSQLAYERALRSRNHLLRADKPQVKAIRAYDEVLAAAGAVVGKARARLCEELGPLVVEAFASIGGEQHELGIRYQPRVTPELADLRAALERSLDKDLARGFTAEGPHADELAFSFDGVLAKRFGSQGQHRAVVLALKVAELEELTRRVGRVPILLLDDVSSELDKDRSRRLFALLAALGGQVFLTTTAPELILLQRERKDFCVRGGVVSEA